VLQLFFSSPIALPSGNLSRLKIGNGLSYGMSLPHNISFNSFIFNENKAFCKIISLLVILQFMVLKLCFPYPDFISDSYNYIQGAQLHLDVNIWPIGYSKFLAFLHWFTTSAFVLILFQYGMYIFSVSYFYFTLIYFFPIGKITQRILSIFLFFNPLLIFLANYVSSDSLFASMSIIWLTHLLWIIRRPRLYQIFIQSILMYILFTFRYNAMIYPILSVVAFLMSPQVLWRKSVGIVSGPALILSFIIWSSLAARVVTGTPQFPPILGGWQWANNALYMRGYIQEDSFAFPTPQTAELDNMARRYFNRPDRPLDYITTTMGNFFIIHPEAPLKRYVMRHYIIISYNDYVASWGKAAVVFDQYGKFLIKRHPLAYVQHYLLVNAGNYILPPSEGLGIYNMGQSSMWDVGQKWFNYASPKVWCISSKVKEICLAPASTIFLLSNIYWFLLLFMFLQRNGIRKNSPWHVQTVFLITLFWLLNAFFSIFANIIVIRYQVFPLIVLVCFGLLLNDLTDFNKSNSK
jgi:hypothetical protein